MESKFSLKNPIFRGTIAVSLTLILLALMLPFREQLLQQHEILASEASKNTWQINEILYEAKQFELALADLSSKRIKREQAGVRFEILWSRVNNIQHYSIANHPKFIPIILDFQEFLRETDTLILGDELLSSTRIAEMRHSLAQLTERLRQQWIISFPRDSFAEIGSLSDSDLYSHYVLESLILAMLLLMLAYMGLELYLASRAHQKELELRRQAMAASAAKTAFVANMSHEIRTPMNGISGMAEILDQTELTEEQKLCVDTISYSTRALRAIINDVLDFSKMEVGKIELAHAPFRLYDTVFEVAVLLSTAAAAKDIEICVDFPVQHDRYLIGDEGRLRQVLTNIVGNAVKFTEKGQVVIRVRCLHQDDGWQQCIWVDDTGIGIDEAALPDIFNAFEQADGSATRRFEGTGLGLAISRHLVEAMGGRISVTSRRGAGSRFLVQLALPVSEDHVRPSLAAKFRLQGKSVLLVDDQPVNVSILKEILQDSGLVVETASSVAEALEQLSARSPGDPCCEVAIIDYSMPGADGLELSARIRSLPAGQDVRIILMSYADIATQRARILAAGVNRVLMKPIRRSALLEAISEVLGHRHPKPFAVTAEAVRRDLAEPQPFAGCRFLVAEDNRVNQLVVRKMLESTGAEVAVAINGAEAVGLFRGGQFDAILMDVSMPVMGGLEATRAIRRLEQHAPARRCPIIGLTAHVLQDTRDDCLAAGMDDIATKPVAKQELLERIARVLEQPVAGAQ